jgi:sugar phosphate isomerase/epimerase
MKFIMFTKHLEGLDVPELIETLKSVGVKGADLCVRPGYPVNPDNASTALPAAAKQFAQEGLVIPLVTTPGDFIRPDVAYAESLYAACGEAGVQHIKLGYWHWTPEHDYWAYVDQIRGYLDGFQRLSEKYGVQTCIHNHSGLSMGLNSGAVMNLVKGFDPRYVGVFADPGHLSICGEPIAMALNIVREYLSVVSLKDLVRQRLVTTSAGSTERRVTWRTRVVRLGHGFGDFSTFLKTLQDMGFDGPATFHSEYSGEPVDTVIDLARCDVRYIRRLLATL